MKSGRQTSARIANDNGKSTTVISRTARDQGAARQSSFVREWAPAILATFFTVDCGSSVPRSVAASTRRRKSVKP